MRIGGDDYPVEIAVNGDDCVVAIEIDDTLVQQNLTSAWRPGDAIFTGTVDGEDIRVQADRLGIGWRLFHAGMQADLQALPPRAAELSRMMPVKEPPRSVAVPIVADAGIADPRRRGGGRRGQSG